MAHNGFYFCSDCVKVGSVTKDNLISRCCKKPVPADEVVSIPEAFAKARKFKAECNENDSGQASSRE